MLPINTVILLKIRIKVKLTAFHEIETFLLTNFLVVYIFSRETYK